MDRKSGDNPVAMPDASPISMKTASDPSSQLSDTEPTEKDGSNVMWYTTSNWGTSLSQEHLLGLSENGIMPVSEGKCSFRDMPPTLEGICHICQHNLLGSWA